MVAGLDWLLCYDAKFELSLLMFMRFLCNFFGIIAIAAAFFIPAQTNAQIEISRKGHEPQIVTEVYNRGGTAYLALDDILPALDLSGYWHSTKHLYLINLPSGQASLYPGGAYMKYAYQYIALPEPALFIDGKLRVSEKFVVQQLAEQLPSAIYYRNLARAGTDSGLSHNSEDPFFSFLLKSKTAEVQTQLRAIALDPAHGGNDIGAIGLGGVKEKDVVLDVALELRKKIKMLFGIPVYMLRNGDYSISRKGRLAIARENPVDALIILHAQAALDKQLCGIHLYVNAGSEDDSAQAIENGGSMMLALSISAALREAGYKVQEVTQSNKVFLPKGNVPTVLIELGYLSNPIEVNELASESGRRLLAKAVLNGIKEFSNRISTIQE